MTGRFPRGTPLLPALVLLVAAPFAGCDRQEADPRAEAARKKWERHREKYGAVPRADEATPLEVPHPTVVLTPDTTLLEGEKIGRTASVMDFTKRLRADGAGDASSAATWVVWAHQKVTVARLARTVEALRLAGDEPTIELAVDVPRPGGGSEIRGVRLAPSGNPELSASNEFAVHAPEDTPVTDFLDQLRARRRDHEPGIEEFSK